MSSLGEAHTIYEKKCHNDINVEPTQILYYGHQRPMAPDHGPKYEVNPSSHHGGMGVDGWLNRWTDGWIDRQMKQTHFYIP